MLWYGNFEGPLLATKSLNKIGHYTDWVIGHVHLGALGWNGFMAFGIIYFLVPLMWKTKLWSVKLANWHFWLGLWVLFSMQYQCISLVLRKV